MPCHEEVRLPHTPERNIAALLRRSAVVYDDLADMARYGGVDGRWLGRIWGLQRQVIQIAKEMEDS